VKDYYNPPFVLVGADNEADAKPVLDLYHAVDAERFVTDTRAASLVKYSCNAFHALKVAFANEIGSLAKSLGANGHDVMKLVCQDTKLNISPAYMRPGFAFGGSCLPKDVRALTRFAEQEAVRLPLLASVLPSNEAHLKRALKLIRDSGHRKIGIVGLSFKAGTDDLRESPMVEVAEALLGWGFEIRIYDPFVSVSRLRGRNLAYVDRHLPHLAPMLVSKPDELLATSTAILTATDPTKLSSLFGNSELPIIDLRSVLASAVPEQAEVS
jgi:GDP-mannose 6-dehydrogenase